jgi:hypothetical protein
MRVRTKIRVASITLADSFSKLNSGTRTPPLARQTGGQFMGSGMYSWQFTKSSIADIDRPDHCDGSFDQYCDNDRTYDNISLIISGFGRDDLLLDMRSYWKDYQGADETLWKHEWNKHGTCISTLETRCFENYSPQQDVLAYFDRTMELFKGLDSYKVRLRPPHLYID